MHRAIAVSAAVLACASGAALGDIDFRFIDRGEGREVRVDLAGQDAANYFAGQLNHEQSGVGMRVTFCAEIEQQTTSDFDCFVVNALPTAVIPAAPGFGAARSQALLDVAAAHFETAATTGDRDIAAAFQILAWEIIYDFDPGVGMASIDPAAGSLVITRKNGNPLWGAVSTAIDTFKAAIGSGSTASGFAVLSHEEHQDQLVPSPAGAALLAGAGLLASRRRR